MMTHEDSVELSQLIGAMKRAKSTVTSSSGQVQGIGSKYAGTTDEMIVGAGVKCLFQALYWLEQAIETFELPVRKSREGKGGVR